MKKLIFFLMVLVYTIPVFSQIQIGSGISTTDRVPIYGRDAYSISQQIVLNSEYINAGGAAGNITKIKWFINSFLLDSAENWNFWDVYISHTTKTSFTGDSDFVALTGLTPVFSGTINPVVGQWMELTLTTPFNFNGVDNILVTVIDKKSGFSILEGKPFFRSYTATARGIYASQDSGPINTVNLSANSGKSRTNTVAQLQFVGQEPSCLPLTNLAVNAIVSNQATVTWTNRVTTLIGQSYELRTDTNVGNATGRVASGTLAATATSQPLTNLTPDTVYYFYVKNNCSATDSSGWKSIEFRTACAAASIPYIVNVASSTALPNCTSVQDVNNDDKTWVATAKPYSSGFVDANVMKYSYSTSVPANDWFYTQELNLVAGQSYRLSFKYRDSGFVEKLRISLGAIGVNTSMTTELGTVATGTASATVKKHIDFIPATSGRYYIGFQAYSDINQNVLYLGDIKLDLSPTCFVPLNVVVNNITKNSSVISWTAPATAPASGYAYEIRTSGNPGETAGLVQQGVTAAGVTTTNITQLLSSTDYQVYVRSICSTLDSSVWTPVKAFKTLCDYPDLVSTTPDTICGVGQAELEATYTAGTVKWYAAATGGTSLATGDKFTTPEISATTSYWVSSNVSSGVNTAGRTAPLTNGTYMDTHTGVVFNVIEDVELKSVAVYSTTAGTIDIKIVNNAGTELYTTGNVNVTAGGITTANIIPLNFTVPTGTGYRMLIKNYSGANLIRELDIAGFPYIGTDQNLVVTNGYFLGTSTSYYYFYDIKYEGGCFSPRTEVIAKVVDVDAPIAAATQTFCKSENATIADLVVTGTAPKWYDSPTSTTSLAITDVLVSGTYYVTQTLNGCESEKIAVSVEVDDPKLLETAVTKSFIYGIDNQSVLDKVTSSLGTSNLNWYADELGVNPISQPDFSILSVGDYTYWLSTKSTKECESEKSKVTIHITAATLTVTAEAQTKVYGVVDPALTYAVAGLKNGETAEDVLSGSLTRQAGETVGTYVIQQGNLIATANYTLVFEGADFEITPALLTVTAADNTKVYGDTDPVLTYAVAGLKNGETAEDVLSGSLTRQAGETVGTYVIQQGNLVATANYTLVFEGADFEITPALLTVTAADKTKIYGDADPALTYTVSGLANGDRAEDVISGNLERVIGEDVGIYAITQGSLSANSNYTLVYRPADLTITKASIMGITFENKTETYDGTAKSIFIRGTLPSGATVSYTGNGKTEAGTHDVDAIIDGGNNYVGQTLSAKLTIDKASIMGITFENKIETYDGTAKSIFIGESLPSGATVSYVGNGKTEAGTYTVTATIDGGNNYVGQTLSAKLTIAKASITGITFNDGTFTYDGTAKSIYIGESLPTGATVSYVGNGKTEAGTYTVTATINGGNNYVGQTLTAKMIIEKASIAGITFNDGTFVYDGTAKSIYIGESLPTGATVSYAGNGKTEAGTHTVIATIDGGNNYVGQSLSAKMIIGKASITGITFNDGTFTYDGTAKSIHIAGTLPSGATVSYVGNEKTEAGTHNVIATIDGGNNYVGQTLSAKMTIGKASITGISFNDGTFVYDGTAKSIYIGGTLPTGATVSYLGNGKTEAGTYTVTVTIGGDNYVGQTLSAKLIIEKAAQTITWNQTLVVGCDVENEIQLTAKSSSGLPIVYHSSNESIAKIIGDKVAFTGVGFVEITASQVGNNNFLSANQITKTLNIRSTGMIKQKWDKVLIFDNSSNQYVKWQWYKDGVRLNGATKQFYESLQPLSGIYYVVATDLSNNQLETCPMTIVANVSTGGIKVVPNPVRQGTMFDVVANYTSTELIGAELIITDLTGKKFFETKNVSPTTKLQAPLTASVYVIHLFLSDGRKASTNMLVN